jgi:hypothetical protein
MFNLIAIGPPARGGCCILYSIQIPDKPVAVVRQPDGVIWLRANRIGQELS